MIGGFEMLIRMALACLLSGVIGIEREKHRHPAGLRTHILVCIGSTLVLICNIYLFELYKYQANVDPARLGAQVISGIGFLGAGTIIKEGISVKGLTTAASLWAVACIGIAIGIGYYTAAILATSFVLIALMIFSKFEYLFYSTKNHKALTRLKIVIIEEHLETIGTKMKEIGFEIITMKTERLSEGKMFVRICVLQSKVAGIVDIITSINKITGIESVEVCE